jgi:hypothetical protein
MDKLAIAKIVWAIFAVFSFLAFRAIYREWKSGEISHSATGSFKTRKIRREDDSAKFQLYMFAMIVMNVAFALMLAVAGFFIFFW